jgi:hypothetical protein
MQTGSDEKRELTESKDVELWFGLRLCLWFD